MKLTFLLSLFAFVAMPLMAEDSADSSSNKLSYKEKQQQLLERFDTDKDGKLSNTEKNAMRDAVRKEKEEARKAPRIRKESNKAK